MTSIRDQYNHLPGAKEWAQLDGYDRPFQSQYSKVRASGEIDRVFALPTRPPIDLNNSVNGYALAQLMTERLQRPNNNCLCVKSYNHPCIKELKPAQGWALYEAPLAGGLIGNIGVGHGKTLLDILISQVMPNCKRAVLLIPPGLQEQVMREYLLIREHFRVPSIRIQSLGGHIVPGTPVLHVIPYSIFSRAESTTLLESLAPDLIIADEGHKLRHKDTARTGRLLRYFANHPSTRLCTWSGTLLGKSVKDLAHLCALALRLGSPLPLNPATVEEWALAVDPNENPSPPGALKVFMLSGDSLHGALHRRIAWTQGVVKTEEGAVDASIYILERKVDKIPEKIQKLLKDLRADWMRPDGELLVDALEVSACANQIVSGFYYRWKFPRNEPAELINRWFRCRKEYAKESREKLKDRQPHLDSPDLLTQAAIRYYRDQTLAIDNDDHLPRWKSYAYPAWREVKDLVYHETEAVWCDDYLAADAAKWAHEHRGIVWYEHDAFGRKVAELGGLPMHGGGPGAEQRILSEKGNRSIVASINAHGTGRDGLQRIFNHQLIANPPANGLEWEQLLGRLHRIGLEWDETINYVYRHTDELAEAIDKALLQARFVQSLMGSQQKLLTATIDFEARW